MFQKIRKIVGTSVLIVFIISLIFVLFTRISGNTASIFGYSLLRVETGSMEPDLKVGSIILVKKVDPETLEKGDVITYYGQETPVKGQLVTHQIYEEPRIEDGKYYFITKGLKNTLPDPVFDESQLFGEVKFKIPLLGTLYDFFSKPLGLIAFFAIMIIAFSTELINLINIIRIRNIEIDNEVPSTADDPVYNEDFEESIEQETSEIITNLEDGL